VRVSRDVIRRILNVYARIYTETLPEGGDGFFFLDTSSFAPVDHPKIRKTMTGADRPSHFRRRRGLRTLYARNACVITRRA